MSSFFESLQPGMQVYECTDGGRYAPDRYELGVVVRLTATQLICESGKRYMRRNGRLVGSDKWGNRIDNPADQEVQKRAERSRETLARSAASERADRAWNRLWRLRDKDGLSADDWEQIAARLEAALTLVDMRKQRKDAA